MRQATAPVPSVTRGTREGDGIAEKPVVTLSGDPVGVMVACSAAGAGKTCGPSRCFSPFLRMTVFAASGPFMPSGSTVTAGLGDDAI